MNWQNDRSLTPRQFKTIIKTLGLTQAGAGRYLGVSARTAHRYASGEAEVSAAEALLLRSLVHHQEVPIVPKWSRKQN